MPLSGHLWVARVNVGWGDRKLSVTGSSKSVPTLISTVKVSQGQGPSLVPGCVSLVTLVQGLECRKCSKHIRSLELNCNFQRLGKGWVFSSLTLLMHACNLNIFYLMLSLIHPFEICWNYEKRTILNIDTTKQIIRKGPCPHNYVRENYIYF